MDGEVPGASTIIPNDAHPRQDLVYRVRLGAVDGEPVFPADLDGAGHVPAPVQVGDPFGRVL